MCLAHCSGHQWCHVPPAAIGLMYVYELDGDDILKCPRIFDCTFYFVAVADIGVMNTLFTITIHWMFRYIFDLFCCCCWYWYRLYPCGIHDSENVTEYGFTLNWMVCMGKYVTKLPIPSLPIRLGLEHVWVWFPNCQFSFYVQPYPRAKGVHALYATKECSRNRDFLTGIW